MEEAPAKEFVIIIVIVRDVVLESKFIIRVCPIHY